LWIGRLDLRLTTQTYLLSITQQTGLELTVRRMYLVGTRAYGTFPCSVH
jgi:hypothetical protein